MQAFISAFAAMVFIVLVLSQCRKPWGPVGRLILSLMNTRHSRVTDWGLENITIGDDDTILDIVCGGGRTVEKLATANPDGRVFGIDYSASSVAVAKTKNRTLIDAGRVAILRGTVSALPFPDSRFDLATAVETHYYWPDLVADLAEVRRILKPGGRVVIIAETYRGSGLSSVMQVPMKLIGAQYLTTEQHQGALRDAGFSDIDIAT